MWFIWDGRARTGPYSELEICRRVASGQWPLALFVRPENSSVFRPLVWMLPEWTSEKKSTESTIIREHMPMHEATQIASREMFEFGRKEIPFVPELLAPNPELLSPVPQMQPPSPASQIADPVTQDTDVDFDFLSTEIAGPKGMRSVVRSEKLSPEQIESDELVNVAPFSLTPSSPVSLQPSKKGEFSNEPVNSVIRAATAAIEEGERQTREFENRKVKTLSNNKNELVEEQQSDEKLEVGPGRIGGRAAVQSPAKASEGSVNLVDHTSATQIKFRRVNPTAPRRRGKGSGSRSRQKFGLAQLGWFLTGQSGASNQPWNLRSLVVMVSVVVFAGVVAFVYFKKKQTNIEAPTFEVTESSAPAINPTAQPKRKKKPKRDDENSTNEARKEVAGLPVGNPTEAPSPQKSTAASASPKKSKMKARPLPLNSLPEPKINAPTFKSETYSTGVELRKYLSKAGPKGFIFVGPITLQERPPKKCAPCRGSGLLSDGTLINLSSFASDQWRKVARKNVVYVRGFLTANGNLNVTINAIDNKPF
ncbi:MAG: hypothetical protein RI953_2481 [Pseudomonadota bacterium]|jgi:hypothetical protein